MSKVITISEDDHGFLGVAKNTRSAVDFLLTVGWLTDKTSIYDEDTDEEIKVSEKYGADWKDYLKSCSLERLNYIFYEVFSFKEIIVWEINS